MNSSLILHPSSFMPISSTDLNKAYLAYFGRPSDISGRATFANKELADVVSAFDSSAESKALYGDSIVNKINAIYVNLFNRDAEPAGLQHWLSKVMSGELTPAGVAIAILNGAQNDDAKAVANKLAAADAFTKAIDTTAEMLGYSGMAAVNSARAFLKTVDATEASLTAAVKGAEAAVAGEPLPVQLRPFQVRPSRSFQVRIQSSVPLAMTPSIHCPSRLTALPALPWRRNSQRFETRSLELTK